MLVPLKPQISENRFWSEIFRQCNAPCVNWQRGVPENGGVSASSTPINNDDGFLSCVCVMRLLHQNIDVLWHCRDQQRFCLIVLTAL